MIITVTFSDDSKTTFYHVESTKYVEGKLVFTFEDYHKIEMPIGTIKEINVDDHNN